LLTAEDSSLTHTNSSSDHLVHADKVDIRDKSGLTLTYQLFIEPKGAHLKDRDRWKETFLKEITAEFGNKSLKIENKSYRLIGVPFYNNEDENIFRENLESALN
jgi:type III restriction enzyme